MTAHVTTHLYSIGRLEQEAKKEHSNLSKLRRKVNIAKKKKTKNPQSLSLEPQKSGNLGALTIRAN